MKKYTQQLKTELNDQLETIGLEAEDVIKVAESSIKILLSTTDKLRKFILKRDFLNKDEEIHFFKEIKPKFLSKLIYYNSIYRIETKKPNGGVRIIRKYYNNELDKLKRYFDNNLEFHKYYRTGSSYLDEYYFLRGKHNTYNRSNRS